MRTPRLAALLLALGRSARAVAPALAAPALVLVVGCGGAYGAAIARGDDFAKAGLWDKAAAEYEAAMRLDPSEPEAQIKLKEARRKMSGERLSKGRALMARGEIAAGLAAIQEAAKLDADSVEAQKALTDANAQALARAEELLGADEGRKALELTALVLKGSPNDPRAKDLDGRVRDRLAEQSYARGDAFQAKGKLGNALVEFAACVDYRADYKDAKLRVGQVKLALEKEITFYVVLDKFADTGGGLAGVLTPELLGVSFDEKLPLKVVAQAPSAKAPPPPPKDPKAAKADAPAAEASVYGVKVSGKFDGYKYTHDQNKVGKTCDYVCGKDYEPNPDYAAAERTVADSERQQAQADDEAARAQQEIDRWQKEVDDKQKTLMAAQADEDKARADLERCEGNKKPGDSSACSSERSRVDSARRSVESARSYLSSPQGSLESARRRMQDARERANRARESKVRATEAMRTTPKMREIPRHCAHNFSVDVHTVRARVSVQLSAEGLADRAKILDGESFDYKAEYADETREAQPNRCPEVAAPDPLDLPNEKKLKEELVTKTITGVREKVLATYERYRQRYLADARREEAAGLADDAVEAYVRYVLTGGKKLDPKDDKQIGEFLGKTRGFGKASSLGSL